jgi:NADH-quinone oxidoreductase subunit J
MINLLLFMFMALSVAAAFLVISAKHPVKAVLSLIVSFIGAAGVWLLLEAEFLAFSLIVVYVGAVMVLFLFVVMMLDVDIAENQEGFIRFWFLPALGGLIFFSIIAVMVMNVFGGIPASAGVYGPEYSNIKAVGRVLFTDFLFPFELAAVLLLAAMVAAISLTFRGHKSNVRLTDPVKQMAVQPSERLKVVKLKTQKTTDLSPTIQQGDPV